jgi:hypothetical protein
MKPPTNLGRKTSTAHFLPCTSGLSPRFPNSHFPNSQDGMAAGCMLNMTRESEMEIPVYLKGSAFGTTIGSGWRRTL